MAPTRAAFRPPIPIQIQHLLKLNICPLWYGLCRIKIQIQHLLKLNNLKEMLSHMGEEFKYNTC